MKKFWTTTGTLVGCILLVGCVNSNETVIDSTLQNEPVAIASVEEVKEEFVAESSEKFSETISNKTIEVAVQEQKEQEDQLDKEIATEQEEVVPTITIDDLIGRWRAYDYSVGRTVTVDISLQEGTNLSINIEDNRVRNEKPFNYSGVIDFSNQEISEYNRIVITNEDIEIRVVDNTLTISGLDTVFVIKEKEYLDIRTIIRRLGGDDFKDSGEAYFYIVYLRDNIEKGYTIQMVSGKSLRIVNKSIYSYDTLEPIEVLMGG